MSLLDRLYYYRQHPDFSFALSAGVATVLASPAFINRIFRMACVLGVDMTLPFRIQYSTDAIVWMDLPFVDQLSVVSCICRYASTRAEDASDQISVMSSTANMCLQLVECVLGAHVDFVGVHPPSTGRVRMMGIDSFFTSSHILFASGLDVSS